MKLLGGLLIAVGLLIAGLSGLCSVTLIFLDLGSSRASANIDGILSGLGMVLMFGGIPFGVGCGLIFTGRKLIAKSRADKFWE